MGGKGTIQTISSAALSLAPSSPYNREARFERCIVFRFSYAFPIRSPSEFVSIDCLSPRRLRRLGKSLSINTELTARSSIKRFGTLWTLMWFVFHEGYIMAGDQKVLEKGNGSRSPPRPGAMLGSSARVDPSVLVLRRGGLRELRCLGGLGPSAGWSPSILLVCPRPVPISVATLSTQSAPPGGRDTWLGTWRGTLCARTDSVSGFRYGTCTPVNRPPPRTPDYRV